MPNGKVYDPLIGKWMSPLWENVLDRVATPTHLNLYRFNGNDPINVRHTSQQNQPTGEDRSQTRFKIGITSEA